MIHPPTCMYSIEEGKAWKKSTFYHFFSLCVLYSKHSLDIRYPEETFWAKLRTRTLYSQLKGFKSTICINAGKKIREFVEQLFVRERGSRSCSRVTCSRSGAMKRLFWLSILNDPFFSHCLWYSSLVRVNLSSIRHGTFFDINIILHSHQSMQTRILLFNMDSDLSTEETLLNF